jgi:hypothetical protein
VVIESGTLRTTSVPGDDPPSLHDRKLEGQDPENAVINSRHVMGAGGQSRVRPKFREFLEMPTMLNRGSAPH